MGSWSELAFPPQRGLDHECPLNVIMHEREGDASQRYGVPAAYNHGMPDQNDAADAKRGRRWNWLLLVPLVLLIYPGLYSRETPVVFGFPFFYWFQFAVVIVTALLTGVVYLAMRRGEGEGNRR
jgi:Protein of unknown function (DUF3311)